ncbi:precorrin-3B C(17)-methyltransferase [Euhalothece natronophila Z-M001]|uniref:Precorrin-3B C(17)-methyltransferase n=1 Tax=Euhalothece natronophila Z-M001 TaxID=522448 RepID=A0A5B8NJU4_9CHRO|nr:precorrin-3B C(17)-methyltransferase [Euhalothece natronophila]QDZ39583.1 precorrin-3B C(17)-methyltransferase [Euhalothece natronophila Z-M001]
MSILLEQFSSLCAIAPTSKAIKTLQPLCNRSGITLFVPDDLENFTPNTVTYKGKLSQHLEEIWSQYQGIIFVFATGAVVRLIAPLLQDKKSDPAVIVMDEAGENIVSLCGGHQGGGETLSRCLAQELGGKAIITGASASLNLPGIDVIGKPFGWRKGKGNWTAVSRAIAHQKPVAVIQEVGSTLWQNHLPENHCFQFETRETEAQVIITDRAVEINPQLSQVLWHPRVLWVGIGCERGTPQNVIQEALETTFKEFGLSESAIAGLATIDIKADELGLVELATEQNYPLKTYTPEELNLVRVPNPSSVVAQEVGTASVAEAAALKVAQASELVVNKQIFKSDQGAVTIAVARSRNEYIGKSGQLYLIGTGPGDINQITPAARAAITEADVILGYGLYLDLIHSLQRPGQIIERYAITEEKKRAERAISLANWGLNVAMVSSGDAGIYGMAGLVFEELTTENWDGKTPAVEVFPGITAMQAAAAKIGAPLMHDFCAISLSDLLTPWNVIKKRLMAAAEGDFITSLYNPRSRSRTEHIKIAQQIFSKHRPPDTPVALVRSVSREDEQITLTTLQEMLDHPIDMLTVVIIGNSSTRQHHHWMITPRGYLGFQP